MNRDDATAHTPCDGDLVLAQRLVNESIESMPFPKSNNGEAFRFSDSEPMPPELILAAKVKFDDGNYRLYLIFFDASGIRSSEEVYDPLADMLSFIRLARGFWQDKVPNDGLQQFIEVASVEMFRNLMYILHPSRSEAMVNLINGVFAQWRHNTIGRIERNSSIQGRPITFNHAELSQDNKRFLDEQQQYFQGLFQMRHHNHEHVSPEQKVELTSEYKKLLSHWKRIRRVFADEDYDWRAYVKSGIPTPDDLLDQLKTASSVADLALEHAARNVGIFKLLPDEKTLLLRQKGVPASGYSRSNLRKFLREADTVIQPKQS